MSPVCPSVKSRSHWHRSRSQQNFVGSSSDVSGRCTVVPGPAELVKPPVPRAAWTSPPTRVWKATEWQVYVAPQGLVGRCVLKSGYMSCDDAHR